MLFRKLVSNEVMLKQMNTEILIVIVHIPQELRIRSGGTERHSASN